MDNRFLEIKLPDMLYSRSTSLTGFSMQQAYGEGGAAVFSCQPNAFKYSKRAYERAVICRT